MANEPLATKGNVLHIYDFRVKPGMGDKFVEAFEAFDHSGKNIMHESPAQVRDGVVCRDTADPDHFYLIAEWSDEQVHRQLRQKLLEAGSPPEFLQYLEKLPFAPLYATVVA